MVVDSARDLAVVAGEIDALAANAAEPNPFYEPWMLLPALGTLVHAKRFAFVLVYSNSDPDPLGRRLLGFFPLERLTRFGSVPVPTLRSLEHRHCFLRAPLVHRDEMRSCLLAFLQWFEASGVPVLQLGSLPMDGPVSREMAGCLRKANVEAGTYHCYERALFRPGPDAETYFGQVLSVKRRKEYRRLLGRLGDLGPTEFRAVGSGEEGDWVQSFLELEARGWKGRNGTAFASTLVDRRFFELAVRNAAAKGRLIGLGLYLDGRPIALSCKLGSGDGAFAFKIAFDEEYSRFSPGALLELEHIQRLHDMREIGWMDSCAAAEHFMANRFWAHKRQIGTSIITAGVAGSVVQQYLRLSAGLAQARSRLARRTLSPVLRGRIRALLWST